MVYWEFHIYSFLNVYFSALGSQQQTQALTILIFITEFREQLWMLKGRIHGYAHVQDSINQTTIFCFLNNLLANKPLSNVLDDSN